MTIEEKVAEFYWNNKKYFREPLTKEDREVSIRLDINMSFERMVEFAVLFATEMCELQKQECADAAKILIQDLEENSSCVTESELFSDEYYYHKVKADKQSILNCKNVCE